MAMSKQQQNIVAVAVMVVIGLGAFVHYMLMPMSKRINEKVTELKKTNSKIMELSGKAKQQGQLERQIDLLRRELAESEKALPSKEEIANLIRYINETAQITGVELKTFRPQNVKREQYFSELPYALEIDASYHSLAQFINTVNQAERIITTRDLSLNQLTSGEDKGVSVKATFKLVTYMIK